MNASSSYDYIIAGGGCAGLSLAVRLVTSGAARGKSILIVDREEKGANDRTWCFWEEGEGLFQPVVYKEWDQLQVYGGTTSQTLDIRPYRYKLIRGIDFYNHCLQVLKEAPGVHFLQASIEAVFPTERGAGLIAGGQSFSCRYLFNSTYQKPVLDRGIHWMLQHFKGWVIETPEPAFHPGQATLMDFRTDQSQGTTFFYVLPFTPSKALIEYTLFSPALLEEAAYEAALDGYIRERLGIETFTVVEKEFGVIPMTNYPFPKKEGHVVHIGTAGGQTKGSSGYTFQAIQKGTAALVESLLQYGHPFAVKSVSRRFHFYDSVLLQILSGRTLEGSAIFSRLFQKNDPRQVLKFLDNETTLLEELRLISTLPTIPFSRAALQTVFA